MGTDPNSPDNRWLRDAMERQIPVIYFLVGSLDFPRLPEATSRRMRGKSAGDETGGEWVKTGRKPSKIAGLITANSTQKSMSNAR